MFASLVMSCLLFVGSLLPCLLLAIAFVFLQHAHQTEQLSAFQERQDVLKKHIAKLRKEQFEDDSSSYLPQWMSNLWPRSL